MGDAAPRSMTVEDYFRLEETSPIRHEYVAGEVYAMSGATARHNRIAGNIFARLLPLARTGPCDAFMNDWRRSARTSSSITAVGASIDTGETWPASGSARTS